MPVWGGGTVMGLLNGAWALTTVLGPLTAGALAQAIGERPSYGVLQALAIAAVGAVWLPLPRPKGELRGHQVYETVAAVLGVGRRSRDGR